MTHSVLFSPTSTQCCLVTAYPDGYHRRTLFENTSSLVNYCNECAIPVALSDCRVSDDFLS